MFPSTHQNGRALKTKAYYSGMLLRSTDAQAKTFANTTRSTHLKTSYTNKCSNISSIFYLQTHIRSYVCTPHHASRHHVAQRRAKHTTPFDTQIHSVHVSSSVKTSTFACITKHKQTRGSAITSITLKTNDDSSFFRRCQCPNGHCWTPQTTFKRCAREHLEQHKESVKIASNIEIPSDR